VAAAAADVVVAAADGVVAGVVAADVSYWVTLVQPDLVAGKVHFHSTYEEVLCLALAHRHFSTLGLLLDREACPCCASMHCAGTCYPSEGCRRAHWVALVAKRAGTERVFVHSQLASAACAVDRPGNDMATLEQLHMACKSPARCFGPWQLDSSVAAEDEVVGAKSHSSALAGP
jgi:hypothetical protein